MRSRIQFLTIAVAALMGLSACGGDNSAKTGESGQSGDGKALSGVYAGELTELGAGVEIEFKKDGTAVLTMITDANRHDMDCTYQSGEARIALSCFGSSGISISRLDGGDLEADMDGAIVRLKKS